MRRNLVIRVGVNKGVMRGVVEKFAIVVSALTILQTSELNFARNSFFRLVDSLPIFDDSAFLELVHNAQLQTPNDVRRVLDIARFFEALEGYRRKIVGAIETTDDKECCVGIALKFFEFADGVIDAELG